LRCWIRTIVFYFIIIFLFAVSFCSGWSFFHPIRPIRTYLQQQFTHIIAQRALSTRTFLCIVILPIHMHIGSHARCKSEGGHNRIIKKRVKKEWKKPFGASSSSCGTTSTKTGHGDEQKKFTVFSTDAAAGVLPVV